ncbi:hypothetical protein CBS101457_006554 [Exobasidium rhododendri]|nr:hypothetical protein CBS101457_006554 [Exobasidium rhododendri]
MSRRATGATTASSSSSYTDTSPHPGFVNLGNTCFLNSVLQATSATRSLRQLYHPDELLDQSALRILQGQGLELLPGPGGLATFDTHLSSDVIEQLTARCKSPVLQLADEEHRIICSRPASRRTSHTGDSSIAAALQRQAGSKEASVAEKSEASTISSTRTSFDTRSAYEPRSSDLPLNTAFRQVMEKTWEEKQPSFGSKSAKPSKVASVNPKRLLNTISSKYDQYTEYGQQDGHELLRHLLDSLRMEELDVIKKMHPPPPSESKRQRRRTSSKNDQSKTQEEKLQPLVDNLFCGKLLSCVVCEGCRHVSHTYEDFYDLSLSIRHESDAKSVGKRDRMRSMADRWKRATSSKGSGGNGASSSSSKSAADSLAMLTDGLMGSVSDTEEAVEVKRSASRSGRSIARPKSAAAGQNAAIVDANSRESAKTFMMKNFQPASSTVNHLDVDKMSISMHSEEKKREGGQGAVAMLRAVSIKSRPASREVSPMREEIHHLVDRTTHQHDHVPHHRPFSRHETKPKRSKQGTYLAKLLSEAPAPTPSAPTNALLWGRRVGTPVQNDSDGHKGAGMDVLNQQASTGLVRALNQFTSVEVLDGANSFACKRCWRILNPPTALEHAKIQSRRMRRGRDEHESEGSSDDETSDEDDDEAEEERAQAGLKQQGGESQPDFIVSMSSDELRKPTRPPTQPHAEWTHTVTQEKVQTIPSIQTTGPQVLSSGKGNSSEPQSAVTPTRAPLLQAPKAITASSKGLTLGEPLSRPNSPGEVDSNGTVSAPETSLSDDETNGKERKAKEAGTVQGNEDKTEEEDQKKSRRIEFKEEQSKRSLPMAKSASMRKRSTHSLPKRALKRFLISETPKVFVFHFKRFHAAGRGFSSYSFSNSYKKIDDYISFPEYLDVKPWLAPPREEYNRLGHLKSCSDPKALQKAKQEEEDEEHERNGEKSSGRWGRRPKTPSKENHALQGNLEANSSKTKYKLYAVVVHSGSMSGGHYTAFVLSDRVNLPSAKDKVAQVETSLAIKASFQSNTLSEDDQKYQKENKSTPSSVDNASPLVSERDRNQSISSDGGPPSSHSISSLESSTGDGKLNEVPSKDTALSSTSEASGNAVPTDGSRRPTNGSNGAPPRPASRVGQKEDHRRWIYASDTVVRAASIEEVLKAQAYMLFYEQM